MMAATQPTGPAPSLPTASARPRNGLGVAALVIGVASLVAALSFILFPIALIASAVGLVIGIVALVRRQQSRATNQGQAIAGVVCNALALALAITFSVQFGTWAARNSAVFTRFDNCLIKSGNRAEVSRCIARFANDVRP
jgi:membrane-bound ClpP family serine protease